jgi:hypothetical protein
VDDRIRTTAAAACRRLLEPLAEIFVALGIGAGEFSVLARVAHVHAAARKLRAGNKKISQSRIAAVTGLTRAEVKRILRLPRERTDKHVWHFNRANRVLDGWRSDRKFHGKDLPIRGTRNSFYALAKTYSGDVPPRAILEELLTAGAVRKLSGETVRLVRRHASARHLSAEKIHALGERAHAVLCTLAFNLTNEDDQIFEGSVVSDRIDEAFAQYLERFIGLRSHALLEMVSDQMKKPPSERRQERARDRRIGVTVLVHRVTSRPVDNAKAHRRKRGRV